LIFACSSCAVPGVREFIAFWIGGRRVLAAMNVNVWDVTAAAQPGRRQLHPPEITPRRTGPRRP
jgi:hypothetical protein